MGKKRKEKAVRMLEQAFRLAVRTSESGMSGTATGRLAFQLTGYLKRLKNLAKEDPDSEFWATLQRTILKLLRYLRQGNG